MGILLLILRIIGFLLAALLLLVAAVVAVPVRYRIRLELREGAEGDAAFRWLFHAVDIRLWYGQEGISWKCRILGIPIFRQKGQKKRGKGKEPEASREQSPSKEGESPRKPKASKEPEALEESEVIEESEALKEPKARKESEALRKPEATKEPEALKEPKARKESEVVKEPEALEELEVIKEAEALKGPKASKEPEALKESESIKVQESSKELAKKRVTASIQKQQEEIMAYQRGQEKGSMDVAPACQEGFAESIQEPAGEGQGSGDGDSKANIFKRIRRFFLKIPEWFQALQSWAAKTRQKLASLKVRFHNIKTLVLEETNQKAFFHVLQEARRLLKHYAPRKASGNLEFCMGGPAQTGEVLGVLSLLPFWARYQVAVLPDFMGESFYVKGTLSCKGHIRAWHFVPSFVRLIKDKNVHRLIAAIRK